MSTRGAGWGIIFVIAASMLWGTTGTAATLAPGVGPLAIGAAAMGLGGLLQAATSAPLIHRHRTMLRQRWRPILLGAVAVAVYPLAFYSSMRLAGVAVGTVVSIGSAPLASAVIERVVDRHALTGRWVIGAVLGLAGAALLCLVEPVTDAAGSTAGAATTGLTAANPLAGILLGLVAGATYAIYSWSARRIMQAGVPSRAAMGATFGVGGLLLMPVLAATGGSLVESWQNVGVGLYMALVPMFFGYVLFGLGLARVRASTATTVSLVEPVVAAILAVVVVGERLTAPGWLGVALVICSLAALTVPMPARVPVAPRPFRRETGEVEIDNRQGEQLT